jgi:zinc D-Ala-D-Ala dipeptidase
MATTTSNSTARMRAIHEAAMNEQVTLIADPRVVRIPIAECGEALVDLRDSATQGGLQLDVRKQDDAGLWLHVRVGVADRLQRAQAQAPSGVNLLVIEGFRPLALQRFYFERYLDELRAQHPDWQSQRLRAFASRYVAPPDIVPPHSTGGAVDVTLVDAAGELDLGTAVNASPEESGGGCFTAARGLSTEAASNRALLGRLMEGAGFVNYGTEWWHWSHGDRYWAFMTGAAAAIYGTAEA